MNYSLSAYKQSKSVRTKFVVKEKSYLKYHLYTSTHPLAEKIAKKINVYASKFKLFKKNKTIINKVLILNYKYVKTLNYQTNKK